MSRRIMLFLIAALMVSMVAALGGSALALTEGQISACTKQAENNGKSFAKGINCKIDPK